jgi:hypothetical protein
MNPPTQHQVALSFGAAVRIAKNRARPMVKS